MESVSVGAKGWRGGFVEGEDEEDGRRGYMYDRAESIGFVGYGIG